MHSTLHNQKNTTPLLPVWDEALIAVTLGDHSFLLHDGRLARQAASCLVVPETGDRAIVLASQNGDYFIVHILLRNRAESAELSIPYSEEILIKQARIGLQASDKIELRAMHDLEITAATGSLSFNARNLFSTIQDNLVQSTRNVVSKTEHCLMEVKQLFKINSKQALITAEDDVKIDAERISIG